jgi:hypothetical protein
LGSLQKIWLNYKDLLLLISFTITLMMDWPAPQIALLICKKVCALPTASWITDELALHKGDHGRFDTLRVKTGSVGVSK